MAAPLLAAAGINYGAGIIGWIIIGLIAGFIASRLMGEGGYGLVGDIIVGIVGALIGGFILALLGVGANGLIWTLITAIVGACILIAILRAVSGRTRV
jgi:uncharacterized membrane protein YeaQ/YmgE (transglycosylase-associated protein family)